MCETGELISVTECVFVFVIVIQLSVREDWQTQILHFPAPIRRLMAVSWPAQQYLLVSFSYRRVAVAVRLVWIDACVCRHCIASSSQSWYFTCVILPLVPCGGPAEQFRK